MATKIMITPQDEREIIRKSFQTPVPPRQVHQSKKAYLRKSKHQQQYND